MKRGMVFTLCALALAASGSAANAQSIVNISLNLRYTNPAVPAQGGTWQLVAKTDSVNGIAAISAYIANITQGAVNVIGNGTTITAATLGSIANGGSAYNANFGNPAVTNLVYGQDPTVAVVPDVGRGAVGAAPGNIALDPLFNRGTNTAPGVLGGNWNNVALIASGAFTGSRPAFASAGANSTDANTLSSRISGPAEEGLDANVTLTVRGDSLNTLNLESPGGTEGLRFGDLNRNFAVAITTDILPALAQIGQGSGKTWDQGDFNGNGSVAITTDILPALANIGLPGLPPAISSVPEPASAGLALVCVLAAGAFRKRFA